MIALLRGNLEAKDVERAIVNVAGVGYEVLIPASTYRVLPGTGGEVSLLTYLAVREDALTLYGFATEAERAAFRMLLSVSQVGPRTALAILSGLGVPELASAVRQGSLVPFTKIGGVGRKTAERVILELKDKVASLPATPGAAASPGAPVSADGEDELVRDAVDALLSLGIQSAKAKLAVGRAHGQLEGQGGVEAMVREALKYV